MSAAAGSPLAPPGRSHLRPVPAGDYDQPKEERVPLPRPGTALPDPALVSLAKSIQATFKDNGLSLADPDTAYAFLVSIAAVRPILDGAVATGLMTEAQHQKIAGMFDAAGSVPAVV